jgi:WhiB family redox-sensing transcriptional regulator
MHLPRIPEELPVSSFPRPHLTLAPDLYAAEEYAPSFYAEDQYGPDLYAADQYTPARYEPVAAQPLALPVDRDADGGEESWRQDALCAETDPEAFFPEKGGSTREAKRVCVGCPVRMQCLEYALDNDERFGIWGGLSERERRRLRLARREPLSA